MQSCESKLKLISNLLSAKVENEGLKRFKTIFYNDFLSFANSENALSNEAEMILKLQEIERDLELISAYPKLHTKNIVAVGGGFSAGKSEFISSFIKSDIKLPIGVVPTTAIPTYVFYEEKESMLGCSSKGGAIELNKIDKNFQSKLSHDFIKSFEFNLKEIMPYMMIGSKMDYSHICFIDTPGYNPATISDGFTSEDVKTAKEFLEEANALIWLIGADASGTMPASDLKFLSSLDLEDKDLYIVYNKADLKSLDDLEDILDVIAESLEDEDIEFQGISAYSSIVKKEYLHRYKSLDEFLQSCDKFASKQEEIYERLKYIYDAYKDATKKRIKERTKIFNQLHSLSLDILEEGKEDDKSSQRISELKEIYTTKKEKENLKRLKEIFEDFKESVEVIFDKKMDFDFDARLVKKSKSPKLYPLKKNGLYGYINEQRKWVIEPQFDYAGDFAKNGLALIRRYGKYGYMNQKCRIVIEPQFDDAWSFGENGLAEVEDDKKRGFINAKGEFFDDAYYFVKNGLTPIKRNEKWGYINNKGKIVIKPQFDGAGSFAENGLAEVEKDGKWGYINNKGKIVIKPQFDGAGSFTKNGLAKVKKDGKWGFIDEKGEIVIRPQFDDAGYFAENGLAEVKKDERYGLINDKGEIVIEPQFDNVYSFAENGLAEVEKDGKYGLINDKGEIVIEPQFDYVGSFGENGFAMVEKDGKLGFINDKGKIVIEPQFTGVGSFAKNGLALIKKDDKYGFINEKGEIVIEPQFDDTWSFAKDGLAPIKKDGKYGVINEKGELIVGLLFEWVSIYDDFIKVKIDENNEGLVSLDGEYLDFDIEDIRG